MTARGSILTNALVHTMNAVVPSGSVLHIEDGRIRAILDDYPESTSNKTDPEIINLEGRIVLPGLCDAHIHIEKYARILDQIDCETYFNT
jgi:predicted amidohydrolase YtcJ